MEEDNKQFLIKKVMDSYAEWWQQPSFAKGYNAPCGSLHLLRPLLRLAAQAVVDTLLNNTTAAAAAAETLMRVDEAVAGRHYEEFLWSTLNVPTSGAKLLSSEEERRQFIKGLVLATLKDTTATQFIEDYVQKLDSEKLVLGSEVSGQSKAAAERLRAVMEALNKEVTDLCCHCCPSTEKEEQNDVEEGDAVGVVIDELERALKSIADAKQKITQLRETKKTINSSSDAPSTSSTPSQEQKENDLATSASSTAQSQQTTTTETNNKMEQEDNKQQQPQTPPPATETTPPAPAQAPTAQATTTEEMKVEEPASKPTTAEPTTTATATEEEEEAKKKMHEQGLIQINKIKGNVETLKSKIFDFKKSAELLDLGAFTHRPVDGVKKVESLQKRSREYGELLMRDLLSLDSLPGSTEELRAQRKAQVSEVQQLMDQMDAISKKLGTIRSDMEKNAKAATEQEQQQQDQQANKKQKQEEQEQQPEEEKQEQQQQQQQEEEEETPTWEDLRLQPKLNVQQGREAYFITGTIPGLRRDAIKIDLASEGQVLVLEGVREPTPAEIDAMTKIIARNHNLRRLGPRALLQLGAGRFGKFHEEFQIPSDVDQSRISASYENGILRVVLPRKLTTPVWPGYGYPPSGRGTSRGHPAPFFQDQDFWW